MGGGSTSEVVGGSAAAGESRDPDGCVWPVVGRRESRASWTKEPRGEADWPVVTFERRDPSNSLTPLEPGLPDMSRSENER